jgi:hypothetical protein
MIISRSSWKALAAGVFAGGETRGGVTGSVFLTGAFLVAGALAAVAWGFGFAAGAGRVGLAGFFGFEAFAGFEDFEDLEADEAFAGFLAGAAGRLAAALAGALAGFVVFPVFFFVVAIGASGVRGETWCASRVPENARGGK